jgi:hypothetical protein
LPVDGNDQGSWYENRIARVMRTEENQVFWRHVIEVNILDLFWILASRSGHDSSVYEALEPLELNWMITRHRARKD